MHRQRRRDLATFFRYSRSLVFEFRWTLIGLTILVALGTFAFAVTPLESLHDHPPGLLLAALASWMALFGEPVLGATDVWYLILIAGIYPLAGFALIGEGIVRFALLMLSRRRGEKEWMKVMASTYRDHVVLCGVGHLGFRVLEHLLEHGRQVVCIEKQPDARFLEQAKATGVPVLVRDMKEDAALIDAGVEHAQAILIATNDDLANLEVAMDARRLNPRIRIAMRQFDQQMATKFREAFEIDFAFSSAAIAAPTVAAMSYPGQILAAFDLAGQPHVSAKMTIARRSPLISRTVRQVQTLHHAQILSRVPKSAAVAQIPPDADAVLGEGDELVVIAPATEIGGLSQHGGA